MRLWHYELIEVLPKKQLVAQWRELLAIRGSIIKNGTPNHMLVNNVLKYNIDHFKEYASRVYTEMLSRGYKPSADKYTLIEHWSAQGSFEPCQDIKGLFPGWHNDRYLAQCYFNLEEKYDCGGISDEEWKRIEKKVKFESILL